MKIIDTHIHLFPTRSIAEKIQNKFLKEYNLQYVALSYPETLEKMTKELCIESVVIVNQATTKNNTFICSYAKRKAHRAIIGFAIGDDPSYWIDKGAVGIKIHPIVSGLAINDKRFYYIYKLCQEKGLLCMIHTGGFNGSLSEFTNPALMRDVLLSFPSLKVIVAHLGGGFIEECIELAKTFPGLYFDTSSAKPDHIMEFIEKIGWEHLLFGSDFPWHSPRDEIDKILNLKLPDAALEVILYKNAEALFRF